jgi:tetratricopeptide (TPR) repeat protein
VRQLLTRLRLVARLRLAAVVGSAALALVVAGGVLGRGGVTPAEHIDSPRSVARPADLLTASIAKQQKRLREVPGDWVTWAALSATYLEQARVGADPTYYPKAEGAARESLARHPDDNANALVALGALANARHDFATARDQARAALAINGSSSDAYGVLADALTQLGDAAGATDAVQHMLDLRPGLAAFTRASYDLEQRGRIDEASSLLQRALDDAVDPHDVAFCHNQLGDLAWQAGDVATAETQYTAALAADPAAIAGLRGKARTAAATGHVDVALGIWADLTRRTPTPPDLLEYADLLRVAGRASEADAQVQLAAAAQALFTANGGVDGIGSAAIALAQNKPDEAVDAARAEWGRRQFVDVADSLAWALHKAGKDAEALPYAQRVAATGARAPGYAYHLGVIELGLGQRDQARSDLTRAIRANPAFSPVEGPVAQQALAGLGGPA